MHTSATPNDIDTARRQVLAWSLATLLPAAALPAGAADYPSRPIRLIVPFPAGGGPDVLARALAQKMGAARGWTWVVDNRPGAAGNLGTDTAAHAPADGYTVLLGQTAALAVNVSLYDKLPYNPVKDFAPIGLVAVAPLVLVTAADSPWRSFRQVMDTARQQPGKITLGFSGSGTVSHLSCTLIQKTGGVQLQAVPYKGASQALVDVMGGNINLYLSSFPSLLGHVRGGKLRALAVTSAARSAELPDVPTIAEQGFPNFEAVSWFGMLAPAGVPAPILKQLHDALDEALADPFVIDKFKADGSVIRRGTAEDFGRLIAQDIERWRIAVRESGAKVE